MTLPFERWGRGSRPALFLHGFTGTMASWRHLEPLLGDELWAMCVDLPGHGQAAAPEDDPRGFVETVDELAEMLEAPAVVVGYSQGARLALALAVRHPERVDRLILESGSPGLHRRADRSRRRRADDALARLIVELGVEAFVDRWEASPIFAGLRRLPPAEQAALRKRRTSHRPEGLAAALRSMGQGAQPDFWPALTSVLRPTLIVTGALDAKYTRIGGRMVNELPLGWRATFEGVGHAPHLECREAYARELKQFIAPRWHSEPEELVP